MQLIWSILKHSWQPIRKALKTPEFVLSEAIYCRPKKKLRGAGQVQKA